jgi:hypothetical protein
MLADVAMQRARPELKFASTQCFKIALNWRGIAVFWSESVAVAR